MTKIIEDSEMKTIFHSNIFYKTGHSLKDIWQIQVLKFQPKKLSERDQELDVKQSSEPAFTVDGHPNVDATRIPYFQSNESGWL